MLRTGLLLPRSTLFPALGLDFNNGIKEFLKSYDIIGDVSFIIDNIGFGINEQEIYTKAEKMLLQDDVDIVILFADSRIAELLQPLFTACNKILLVVNFGANFPENWMPAPTTITHSLNFCYHARLTGQLAARKTNQQAMYAVSYYDGGYRQCFCMLNAHQLLGGKPLKYHITHLKSDQFTLEPIASFLEENNDVKTLLCLFAGDQAELFYKEIVPLQKKYNLSLYVSPMMLDEALTTSLKDVVGINNTKGYIPWHSSLINESNDNFKKHYTESTGQPVNYFSLLGWETGLLLKEILLQQTSGNNKAAAIISSLKENSFASPRGWLKIDAQTNHSYGPSYLAVIKDQGDIQIESEFIQVDEEWRAFTEEKLHAGENSSWRNTYLCI